MILRGYFLVVPLVISASCAHPQYMNSSCEVIDDAAPLSRGVLRVARVHPPSTPPRMFVILLEDGRGMQGYSVRTVDSFSCRETSHVFLEAASGNAAAAAFDAAFIPLKAPNRIDSASHGWSCTITRFASGSSETIVRMGGTYVVEDPPLVACKALIALSPELRGTVF